MHVCVVSGKCTVIIIPWNMDFVRPYFVYYFDAYSRDLPFSPKALIVPSLKMYCLEVFVTVLLQT